MTETPITGDAAAGTAKKLRNQSLLLLFAALFTSPLFLFFVLSFPLGMGVMFHLGHQARVLLPVPCVVFCLLSLVWAWRTSKALPKRKIGDAPVFLLMSVAVAVLLLSIPMFFHTLTALTRTACQSNQKMHGLGCSLFAKEEDGLYPPLSMEPGRLAYAVGEVCGQHCQPDEWLCDARIMVCPGDSDYGALSVMNAGPDDFRLMDDWSYFYLGYAVGSDAEMQAFSKAYLERMARGEPLCEDIKVGGGQGSNGSDTLFRLRRGMFQTVNAQGEVRPLDYLFKVPVLIERRGNHPEDAIHVLWLAGNGSLVRPGQWPNTDETMAALAAMDALSAEAK